MELVGWEDTVSQLGRPQAIINQDMGTCELFIGIMWKHWGSTPAISGPYTSGFEEEFSISLGRYKSTGEPQIKMFFKSIGEELKRDAGPSLKKVIDFRQDLIDQKQIYFEEFSNSDNFSDKFRKSISKYIQELIQKKVDTSGAAGVPAEAPPTNPKLESTELATPVSGSSFLGQVFLAEVSARKPKDGAATLAPIDVARLRLVSNALGTSSNDKVTLQPHDANLVFRHRRSFTLEVLERGHLRSTGLVNFESENVPLWYWLSSFNAGISLQLSLVAKISDNQDIKSGAIKALILLQEPFVGNKHVSRSSVIASLLSEKISETVRAIAISHLGETGAKSDMKYIETEYRRNNSETQNKCIESKAKILFRENPQKALEFILQTPFESISGEFLEKLFTNANTSAEQARIGATHRSKLVRKHSLNSLITSKKSTEADLSKALSDSNVEIRYIAINELLRLGRPVSEEKAESTLIRSEAGIAGFDWDGREKLKMYKRAFFATLPLQELQSRAESASIYDLSAVVALYEVNFANLRHEIVRDITGRFEGRFAKIAKENDLELVEYVRDVFVRDVLDVITSNGDKDEIYIVKKLISDGIVKLNNKDLEFLKKHVGDADVEFTTDLELAKFQTTALVFSNESMEAGIAEVIVASMPQDIEAALSKVRRGSVLENIIRLLSSKDIDGLSNEFVMTLLNNDHAGVRRMICFRLILTRSQPQLREFIEFYEKAATQIYYNVIHWLDFGTSVSAKIAQGAVRRLISGN